MSTDKVLNIKYIAQDKINIKKEKSERAREREITNFLELKSST